MTTMRWNFYNQLKVMHLNVSMAYGYITKNTRIVNNLEKSHVVDARCISGNPLAIPSKKWLIKPIRRHNRQIHKSTILKGGIRKKNQAKYKVFNFRLFDKVQYNNNICFIFSRRSSGKFDIRKLNGIIITRSIIYKKLKFIEENKNLLYEEA